MTFVAGLNGRSYSQQIYLRAQLNGVGVNNGDYIYGLAVNVTSIGNSNAANVPVDIYVKNATRTTWTQLPGTNTCYGWEPHAAADLVFSGNVNFNQAGWVWIPFDCPFVYNGSDSIVISVYNKTTKNLQGTTPTLDFQFTYSPSGTYRIRLANTSVSATLNPVFPASSDPCLATTTLAQTQVPNIKFRKASPAP